MRSVNVHTRVFSLGYAPTEPEHSQPWEQTNEDGGLKHGTYEDLMLLVVPNNWNYINRGDTRACLLAVPSGLACLLGQRTTKLAGLYLLLPIPPTIGSGWSIKPKSLE